METGERTQPGQWRKKGNGGERHVTRIKKPSVFSTQSGRRIQLQALEAERSVALRQADKGPPASLLAGVFMGRSRHPEAKKIWAV